MNDSRTLRVGVTQFELRSEPSLKVYNEHVERLVVQAVAESADLVVFPEFASTGLLGALPDHTSTKATINSDYRDFLASLWDGILVALQRMAAEHQVTILGGSHNRIAEDGGLRNTAPLVHPDGTVELQDKIHLTPPELDMDAVGGDDVLVTKVGRFTVGVLICADIQFPELSRYLADESVDLILNPSLTWNRRGAFRIRNGANSRANENQMYVAMSPLFGSSGLPEDAPLFTVGRALVSCPIDKNFGHNDGLVAIADHDDEGVVVTELDLDRLAFSRENPEPPGLKLQRPDIYEKLLARMPRS